MSDTGRRAFRTAYRLRWTLRSSVRAGCGAAARWLRIGFRRNPIVQRPDARQPPTISIAGSDRDARRMPVPSSMSSSAHDGFALSVTHGSVLPPYRSKQHAPARRDAMKTMQCNETQRSSMTNDEEPGDLANGMACVKRQQTSVLNGKEQRSSTVTQRNAPGNHNETRTNGCNPVGHRQGSAGTVSRTLAFSLLPSCVLCESVPSQHTHAVAVRRQFVTESLSRVSFLVGRQK